MNNEKEKSFKLTVNEDGNTKIEVSNLNPMGVISLCTLMIQESLKKIKIKEISNIAKPNMGESIDINQTKN